MTRRNVTKGQRLIELWSALQDRNTTVLRIVALSADCGIDARQVLADHFRTIRLPGEMPGAGWRRPLNKDLGNYVARNCEQPSPISSPGERLSHSFVRATGIELLQQCGSVYSVYANEELSDPASREPGLNINRRPIIEFFIVTTMMKLIISPLPKLSPAFSHALHTWVNGARIALRLPNIYTWKTALSKLSGARHGWTVSGVRS